MVGKEAYFVALGDCFDMWYITSSMSLKITKIQIKRNSVEKVKLAFLGKYFKMYQVQY